VIRGIAVATIDESRRTRKQTNVTAAKIVNSLKPEIHSGSGSCSWLASCLDSGSFLSGGVTALSSLALFSRSNTLEDCGEGGIADDISIDSKHRTKEVVEVVKKMFPYTHW